VAYLSLGLKKSSADSFPIVLTQSLYKYP